MLYCAGTSVERTRHDYGIDLVIYTYDQAGYAQPGEILLQLKATDALKWSARSNHVAFRIDRADLNRWLAEPMPVILIVYDAAADVAYWLYIQEHFEQRRAGRQRRGTDTVTVRIPRVNVVNSE